VHSDDSHLTDVELLRAAEGDRPPAVQRHLSQCWACRARKAGMETTIIDFTRLHRDRLDPLPPVAGPRALLKARLAQAAAATPARQWGAARQIWGLAAAGLLLLLAATISSSHWRLVSHPLTSRSLALVSLPEPSLTPGAIIIADRDQVCRVARPKNRAVPVSLQRRVFEEYGIPGATPQAYEVDYLITPALGGADDIRNLWPQSYSQAVWNAHVKDQLEDHLRGLVCAGDLDLTAAQHEIASDWIAAYKKYFHTEVPVVETRQ
jgi:hypothetical protein